MFAGCLRFVLSVIVSPRRLLVAALFATFLYAALVATRARLFPEPALRAGKSVATAPAGSGGRGGARTE
jgi:hypothetical protein